MTEAADHQERDPETGAFLKGKKGGPGRPKGSRNKLGEAFITDLYEIWQTDGAAVLQEARTEKPMEFAKMIAGMLPKEVLVRTRPTDEMTDDELAERLGLIEGLIAQLAGSDAVAEGVGSGTGTKAVTRPH